MIAALRGKVLFRGINRLVLDVQGVGYDVAVTLSALESLQDNGDVFLHVYTALRENNLELYGFVDRAEKLLFEMLLTVNGIGPRTALTILSGISPTGFQKAILEGNVHTLTSIPGVGRKSAERMVLELKQKVSKMGLPGASAPERSAAATLHDDLISSLVNLGYKERIATDVAQRVIQGASPDATLSQAVRVALKELMK
ncbi:MAG: Holliday junction branch migration protein RuvA [Desulfomonile tiedjei]|nr:Holliday junction branch migration protein RuvA [Desulfomonile tiedjei]